MSDHDKVSVIMRASGLTRKDAERVLRGMASQGYDVAPSRGQ